MNNPIAAERSIRCVAVKLLVATALVALLGAAGAARADNPMLIGDVGLDDSYTITLKDANGAPVTHLPAGTYTLVIHDHSSIHNFDLNGPGVSVATGIDTIGDKTVTVTFTDGTYFYVCDDHASRMKGSFTVGNVTAPPPPAAVTRLSASIAAGGKATLKPSSGLSAGQFKLTVSDRTAADGFRLSGPGVSKATGVTFKGTVTWTGMLQDGKYSFGSVRKPKLRRSFSVSG